MQVKLFTFSDVLSAMLDWTTIPSTDALTLRKIKRSIASAYREFLGSRNWSILMGRGRITTQAQYNTGTIEYDNATRTITLTDGTFPSWTMLGRISFGSPLLEYQIVDFPTSTTAVLSVNANPGADVAAGTSYTLFQDAYPLPVNCQSVGTIKDAQRNVVLQYMEPNDWVALRPYNTYPAVPRFYTISADPNYIGTLAMRVLPPPDIAYNFDFMYKKYPRDFSVQIYNTGTISSSGTSVTGSGTAWTSAMIGCVIRYSSSARTKPTGLEGDNPYVEQRIITSVGTPTALTIDQAFSSNISGMAYEISDPIELEANAMYTAFLRRVQADLGPEMKRSDIDMLKKISAEAYVQACEQDSRSFDQKPEGARYFQRVPTYWSIANST